MVFEDDILPSVGATYIFCARSEEDTKGKLQLRCGLPNMTIRLSGKESYVNDAVYTEYKQACQDVIPE